MTAAVAVLGALGAVWLLSQSFATRLTVYLAVLPFLTWAQIHVPFRGWSLVGTGLLVITVVGAAGVAPGARRDRQRPAVGLTVLVLLYAAVAVVGAANPGLPSLTLGVRGARLFIEPLLLYFVGAEVAREPQLWRRVRAVIVVTGVIVAAYALKQALFGFDHAELAYYRANFSEAASEARVSGTMAGATDLGNYMALVGFIAVGHVLHRGRRALAAVVLAGVCTFDAMVTGQRGVMIAAGVAVIVVVALGLARRSTRSRGARFGQVVTLLAAVLAAVLIVTPVQNRRVIREQHTDALHSALIKLALLKQPSQDTSLTLRQHRLAQTRDALLSEPFGAGAGLNLMLKPGRSGHTTALGSAGFGGPTYRPPLPPLPGELYFYTVASELGVPGLALFLAIAVFGMVTAVGVAVRHPDREKAALGMAAAGFIVFVLVDAFTVDVLASTEVAAYYWLLVGMVGRWGQEDRVAPSAPTRGAVRGDTAVAAGVSA